LSKRISDPKRQIKFPFTITRRSPAILFKHAGKHCALVRAPKMRKHPVMLVPFSSRVIVRGTSPMLDTWASIASNIRAWMLDLYQGTLPLTRPGALFDAQAT